jgi:glycopeptide antibiotics resistance protein
MLKVKVFKNLWKLAFIIYIFFLLYLTILKRFYFGSVTGLFLDNYQLDLKLYLDYNVNLIPFKTIIGYLTNPPNTKIAMTNIIGNILAFMPLGFLTPVIFKRLQLWFKVCILSFGVSMMIEITQILLRVGSADIDDLILNTLGGLIGYFLFIFSKIISARFNRTFERKF